MELRNRLFVFYWKAQAIIAPKLVYSQRIYEEILSEYAVGEGRWLDLGCGHQLLPPWRFKEEQVLAQRSSFLVGVDSDLSSLQKHRTITHRVAGDISKLPFVDGSFDLVTSNMVFEHLEKPELQLAEIHRILKRNGMLIFHTPNVYGYPTIMARLIPEALKRRIIRVLQQREGEDVYPTYYRVNSESRIRQLAERLGFRVKKTRLIVTTAAVPVVPPVAVLELLWIRSLMTKPMRRLRTNIVAFLEKT